MSQGSPVAVVLLDFELEETMRRNVIVEQECRSFSSFCGRWSTRTVE